MVGINLTIAFGSWRPERSTLIQFLTHDYSTRLNSSMYAQSFVTMMVGAFLIFKARKIGSPLPGDDS